LKFGVLSLKLKNPSLTAIEQGEVELDNIWMAQGLIAQLNSMIYVSGHRTGFIHQGTHS